MNNEVINHRNNFGDFGRAVDETSWFSVLESYYGSARQSLVELGENGRVVIEENYSARSVAIQLETYFKKFL
jgi:hypothetical protein